MHPEMLGQAGGTVDVMTAHGGGGGVVGQPVAIATAPQGWVSWMAIAGQAIMGHDWWGLQVAGVVVLVIVRHLVGGPAVEAVAVGCVVVGHWVTVV
ncbi:hypothetical protein VC83_08774 [Pseudogymnoascus destructans]|uniref:Uncharacterized protein n=1 Tax=Pseudogymnoascus destructans TaxID=655981 RepID=A0A176ZYN4_9PEZI|nr:uncharacterized protein VC83_08774 [Pseudogymnoascus destructans]OAF55026.1 hypothetical protein VC83_08774 [Pseudogymnoascus destructans]